jgi:hypothetical protein
MTKSAMHGTKKRKGSNVHLPKHLYLSDVLRKANQLVHRRNPNQDLPYFDWGKGAMQMRAFISSGAYSSAFLGNDGMVYIITEVDMAREESSKLWLAQYQQLIDVPSKHLPKIILLGLVNIDQSVFYLFRSPRYLLFPYDIPSQGLKINDYVTYTAHELKILDKVIGDFAIDPGYSEHTILEKLPSSRIKKQLVSMLHEMVDFEDYMYPKAINLDGLYRDWSIWNLGWDSVGNIINFDPYVTEIPFTF